MVAILLKGISMKLIRRGRPKTYFGMLPPLRQKRITSPFAELSSMYFGWSLKKSVPFEKLMLVQTDREATLTYYLESHHGLISSESLLLNLPKNWIIA